MRCACGFESDKTQSGDVFAKTTSEAMDKRSHDAWMILFVDLRICPDCGAVYTQLNQKEGANVQIR